MALSVGKRVCKAPARSLTPSLRRRMRRAQALVSTIFPCGVERGDVDHAAVRQPQEAGNPFVVGEVVLSVLRVPFDGSVDRAFE